jgi:hypothetical protein
MSEPTLAPPPGDAISRAGVLKQLEAVLRDELMLDGDIGFVRVIIEQAPSLAGVDGNALSDEEIAHCVHEACEELGYWETCCDGDSTYRVLRVSVPAGDLKHCISKRLTQVRALAEPGGGEDATAV